MPSQDLIPTAHHSGSLPPDPAPLRDSDSQPAEQAAPPAKDAPMLDVHPPHHPIHTWKEFLLHMSTIVLGLLIAIGLEQTVEAVHRSHERAELRESLQNESRKAIVDALSCEQAEMPGIRWAIDRSMLVGEAVAQHRTLGRLPTPPHISSGLPIDPAWNAAKVSGLLPLLTQEEVQVYSEADRNFVAASDAYTRGIAASRRRAQFEFPLVPKGDKQLDLSSTSPADLQRYSDLVGTEANAWDDYRVICQRLRGAEVSILAGQRDLSEVQKAELQFYTPIPH